MPPFNYNDKPLWDLFDNFHDNPESALFDSLINEFTEISGFPIEYYVKLDIEDSDYLYGEDQNEEFSEAFKTRLVYEPTEEPEILNAFGMSSDDTLSYAQIPKSKFNEDIVEESKFYNDYTVELPKVGDVVKTLWNNKLYEVAEVGSEQKIFQGIKLVWELILKPYRHSEESQSADDMLFAETDEEEFPDININHSSDSKEDLSGSYGENQEIEEESFDDPDANTVYGYK